MNDRGSDRLPLNCFHLRGANASQFRAISGGPSVGRASRSNGACTVTIQASPAAEEVHAPRTFPGVCEDTGVSNELDVSFVLWFTRPCFYLSERFSLEPANMIQLSKYCVEYIILTCTCQGSILESHGQAIKTNHYAVHRARYGSDYADQGTVRVHIGYGGSAAGLADCGTARAISTRPHSHKEEPFIPAMNGRGFLAR